MLKCLKAAVQLVSYDKCFQAEYCLLVFFSAFFRHFTFMSCLLFFLIFFIKNNIIIIYAKFFWFMKEKN